jgi:FkbM family methyltransferase
MRQSKADTADAARRPFRYTHPIAGDFIYQPADYLSRRVFLHDNFERLELRYAAEHATHGGTIVDVGANVGLYTVACARAAAGRGRVVAVEPGPATFAKLADTCGRLGLTNVTLVPAAAGRAEGSGMLVTCDSERDVHQHLADRRPCDAAALVEVAVRPVDGLGDPSSVTLLKVDVEGHEVDVLGGARQVLANGRVRAIVEFFPDALEAAGASVDALWHLLASTHRCLAVVCQDSSMRPPERSSLSGSAGETWNTIWVPR